MEFFTLPLGPLQTNCYLIPGADGRCLVIDPGAEAEKVLSFLASRGLTLEAILLTHGHFDHVGAVRDLAAETGCRVFLCDGELSQPTSMTAGPLYSTDSYAEGDELTLAGLTFRVMQTPGHTPGSVCLHFGTDLFCGDTLFAGSCGRTDFPGGSSAQMRQSLTRLSQLEATLRAHPGHGPSTTIAEERRFNPFMQ